MEVSPAGTAATLVLCACLLFVGFFSVVWPERIQRWMLSFHEGARGIARWNPLLDWMRTSSYIISLRIAGALSLAAGLLVLLAVARAIR